MGFLFMRQGHLGWLLLLASCLGGCAAPENRSGPAVAVANDPDASQIAEAIGALDNSVATPERTAARRFLAERVRADDEATIKALTEVLQHESIGVRLMSLSMLDRAAATDPQVVDKVIAVLMADPEPKARVAAAKVLANSPPSAPVARAIASRMRIEKPRLQFLWTLKKMKRHAAVAVAELVPVLEHPDRNLRYHAAAALAEAGVAAAPALPRLIALLDDEAEDKRARNMAIVVLGNIGPTAHEAFECLLREFADPATSNNMARFVRADILFALSTIGVPADKRLEVFELALNHLQEDQSGRGTKELLTALARPGDAPTLLLHLERAVQSSNRIAYATLIELLIPLPARGEAVGFADRWVAKNYADPNGLGRDLLLATGVDTDNQTSSLAIRLVRVHEWPEMQGPMIDLLTAADQQSDMVNAVLAKAEGDQSLAYHGSQVAATLALRAARRGNQADLRRLRRALTRIEALQPTYRIDCRTGEPRESAVVRMHRAVQLLRQ